jgi:ankyrin repeat protein
MVSPDRVQKAMNAASTGDIKTLRLMLKGGVPVNHVERSVYGGRTESLLSLAAHYGQLEAFDFLLAEGADINFRAIIVAGSEWSMLEVACGDRLNPQVVQIILSKAHISQTDKNFALVIAAYQSLDAVNMLLSAGAEVNATGRYDDTALLNAVLTGKESIAVRLIEAGADATVRQLNSDLDYWRKSAAEIAREMKLQTVNLCSKTADFLNR